MASDEGRSWADAGRIVPSALFCSAKPDRRDRGRFDLAERMGTLRRYLLAAGLCVRFCRAGLRRSGNDRGAGHDARRSERQGPCGAANPRQRRNRRVEVQPRLVLLIVAKSLRLHSGRGRRRRPAASDFAGERTAAAGRGRAADHRRAPGADMERTLCRLRLGIRLEPLVILKRSRRPPATPLPMRAGRSYMPLVRHSFRRRAP